jgi:histidinol phosphatase-like PHP family hydrolase
MRIWPKIVKPHPSWEGRRFTSPWRYESIENSILNEEPIDIYVNPTFLPEVIASEYDTLWTPSRMQRVIDAAKKNRVAIELNSRYRLPHPPFVKLAKQAGLKFTLGINNTDANLGRSEFGLEMIRECGLGYKDFWMPGRNKL